MTFLLSTIADIYKGNQTPFQDTFICNNGYDFKKHKVISLDVKEERFNPNACASINVSQIHDGLTENAKANNKYFDFENMSVEDLLEALVDEYSKEGEVVLLIDGYDHFVYEEDCYCHQGAQQRTIKVKRFLRHFKNIRKSIGKIKRVIFVGESYSTAGNC